MAIDCGRLISIMAKEFLLGVNTTPPDKTLPETLATNLANINALHDKCRAQGSKKTIALHSC
ncbi:hypothetical protein NC653_004798 [Populus alba x Populus x berolinensis]|uniref:Uncharacterized protein n=2 Tax=Populus alba x Populus x berolinensis TaxID=444605 RepID=A0AAD6WL87_9ROSI|nr:hypothetical protein NC653_002814 [Populus alba x Populus x berolinensis]KAJ7015606.1 hypothetical protein NC653_004798 [Populus alba x Populus x berolinensis]